jgi:L-ribulose-5-phosphate 4-epimerase
MPLEFPELREAVVEANLALARAHLVTLTWGNASVVDRRFGVFGIKPSGVPFERLKPEDIPVLSLDDGRPVSGQLRPSSDAPTHLVLYRYFSEVGAVVHTHSRFATAWAQAERPIPCLGTTHADHFRGPVPLVRMLSDEEIRDGYETRTGAVIVEYFVSHELNPLNFPGALVPRHGPFAWGENGPRAVENAIALEMIAELAAWTMILGPEIGPIRPALLDRHFMRKHGWSAYYGQREIPQNGKL